jgi:YVTN family beta-propeller protein
VTSSGDGKALGVDPKTGSVLDSVGVGRAPAAIATTREAVWIVNAVDGTVSRIDPQAAAVKATIPVEEGLSDIAAGPGGVWVAGEQKGSINRIDPRTNQVSNTISIGSTPVGVAVDPNGIFVAVRPAAGAHRGGTLTFVNPGWYDPGSLDPAVSFSNVLNLTNDGLTAFKRVGGRESTQIVPDLATSLPEPGNAGRTYTFRLRKGIRYSTGQLVQAGDIRRALEPTSRLPRGTTRGCGRRSSARAPARSIQRDATSPGA